MSEEPVPPRRRLNKTPAFRIGWLVATVLVGFLAVAIFGGISFLWVLLISGGLATIVLLTNWP